MVISDVMIILDIRLNRLFSGYNVFSVIIEKIFILGYVQNGWIEEQMPKEKR